MYFLIGRLLPPHPNPLPHWGRGEKWYWFNRLWLLNLEKSSTPSPHVSGGEGWGEGGGTSACNFLTGHCWENSALDQPLIRSIFICAKMPQAGCVSLSRPTPTTENRCVGKIIKQLAAVALPGAPPWIFPLAKPLSSLSGFGIKNGFKKFSRAILGRAGADHRSRWPRRPWRGGPTRRQ
jgi:hypothetical protein